MPIDLKHGFRFGAFTAEPLKGCITGDDMKPRHLPPKAMDVLVRLAEAAPEPVTREELLNAVWGERFVSDEVLTHAIKELRHALGDLPSNPQYIRTIPKRGYQLLKTAHPIEDSLPDKAFAAIQRNVRLAVPVVAVALVLIIAIQIRKIEPEPVVVEDSIAVLPFGVCGQAPQELLIATGISEEVINRLSERGKLKVIARSSIAALAEYDLPIPEIAMPLGVQYVLQGILCHTETTPTLTAELSDAQGFIVWSNTFVQKVDEFDKVTVRLASQVANGVAAKLGDVTDFQQETPVNSRAYEQLLIGRQYRAQGREQDARVSFEKALAIDPDFAEPMLELVLLDRYRDHLSLKAGVGLAEARDLAQQALASAQDDLRRYSHSARAHHVTGKILFTLASLDRDLLWRESKEISQLEISARKDAVRLLFAEAEHHFSTAISLNPSLTDLYYDLAFALEGQGRQRDTEALKVLEKAMARDPLNARLLGRIAKRWAARGRFRHAIELLEKLKALPEIPPSAWWWQLELMHLQTYWDEKVETLIDMLQRDPGAFKKDWSNRWQAWWTVSVLAWLGLYEEAEAWKVRLENMEMTHWMHEWGLNHYLSSTGKINERARRDIEQVTDMSDEDIYNAFHEWGMGFVFSLAQNGELDRAIKLMESIQHAPGFWAEREIEPMLMLAALYQAAGRELDAQPVLSEVVDYLEAEYDSGIRHPHTLDNLAQAYARQGRDDDALEMLRKAFDYHSRDAAIFDNRIWKKHEESSAWFRLREDPRFIALVERMHADLAQQARRVRSMLALHDIDELLEPLMALTPDSGEDD